MCVCVCVVVCILLGIGCLCLCTYGYCVCECACVCAYMCTRALKIVSVRRWCCAAFVSSKFMLLLNISS
jgi:hypothetical protein